MLDEPFLIPIVFFICIAVVLSLAAWFYYLIQASVQETLRTALEKDVDLTPEIIESLGRRKRRPPNDFRRALISLAIGAGFAAFGFILGEEDSVRPLLAIAAFPAMIGIAYLIMWRVDRVGK